MSSFVYLLFFSSSFTQLDMCVLLGQNPKFLQHKKEAGLFHKDTTEREIATRIKPVLWKSGAAAGIIAEK